MYPVSTGGLYIKQEKRITVFVGRVQGNDEQPHDAHLCPACVILTLAEPDPRFDKP